MAGLRIGTWGVAPGWYENAPLALREAGIWLTVRAGFALVFAAGMVLVWIMRREVNLF